MLTLLTFPGDGRLPSLSPFCVKAMCLLQMSGQVWQASCLANPSKMPNGKLPVLKTSEALIPDSHAIQAWLEAQGAEFDAGLGRVNRAQAHALVMMAEEGLRYGLLHDRWLREDCWQVMRHRFFGQVPAPLRGMIGGMVRQRIRKTLDLQGTARFSEADRLDRMARDLAAIRGTLDGKPYLFGDSPTSADAAIVPVLDMIRSLPCETGLRRMVCDDAGIMAWLDRAAAELYPS